MSGDSEQDGNVAKPSWIRFVAMPSAGKTKRWAVETLGGVVLGRIHWHGPWRQYAFDSQLAIYEPHCLRDLANFCETETRGYRKNWKLPRLTAQQKAEF